MTVTYDDIVNYRGWEMVAIGRSYIIIYDPEMYVDPESLLDLKLKFDLSDNTVDQLKEALCIVAIPYGAGFGLSRDDVIYTSEPMNPTFMEQHLSWLGFALELGD